MEPRTNAVMIATNNIVLKCARIHVTRTTRRRVLRNRTRNAPAAHYNTHTHAAEPSETGTREIGKFQILIFCKKNRDYIIQHKIV